MIPTLIHPRQLDLQPWSAQLIGHMSEEDLAIHCETPRIWDRWCNRQMPTSREDLAMSLRNTRVFQMEKESRRLQLEDAA